MSKIGKQLIEMPTGASFEVEGSRVLVKGPKGELSLTLPRKIEAVLKEGKIEAETKQVLSLHGTVRSLINNMVKGVTTGFTKQLELIGTGFRAEAAGRNITLTVGYSHPVKIEAPEGINIKVEKNIITVEGINKETVGQVAADIRGARPPEPYKGKGIKYVEEVIRRKPGKAAAKAGSTA